MLAQMDIRKLLTYGLVLLVLGGVWWWVTNPLVVTVTGEGEVVVPAEKAYVSLTVSEINASPVVASQNVEDKANRLRTLFGQRGVSEGDISQSQVRVVPASAVVQGATGYQATLAMGATLTNVAELSNFVPSLYEQGATLVSQPVLQVNDEAKYEEEALQAALREAKSKATKVGWRQAKLIKKVAAISTSSNPVSGTITTSERAEEATALPGTNFKVTKTVSVTYRMW